MKNEDILVSVVMPCLNEKDTIGTCIEKAQGTLKSLDIRGEVLSPIMDQQMTQSPSRNVSARPWCVNRYADMVPHT